MRLATAARRRCGVAAEYRYRETAGPGALRSRTARATPSGSARIAHSHIRSTIQPFSSASAVDRSSRSRFRRIFCSQSSAFGPVNGVFRPWIGHECQKSPSTNTAIPWRGKTMSGVQPGAMRRCSLNRLPAAWSARRSKSSGSVLTFLRPRRWRPSLVLVQPESNFSPLR